MIEPVLFLTPWYPNNVDPMFGLFVRKQAIALSKHLHVGVVAVFPVRSGDRYTMDIKSSIKGLTEIKVYFRQSTFSLLNLYRTYRAYKTGYKQFVKLQGKPKILNGTIFTRTAVITCMLAWQYKIPFVVSEHWSRYFPENFKFTGFIRKIATIMTAKRAKAVIVPSKYLESAMLKCGIHANYRVVPNVIDEELFLLRKDIPPFGIKKIIHISCFEDKSKNISGLLHSIALLREKRNDFELHLVGTGEDIERMKALVHTLQIQDFVVFQGLLENEELASLLKTATCSVLSSHYETFAIVVYESLACGVPVVVTDVAGLGEIITSEMGIVVCPDDQEALANALQRMLDTANQYDSVLLRNFILKGYTGEAVAEKLLEIYR